MKEEGMLKPALIGGVLIGILSAIPLIQALNCLCCAWVIAGGVFASYLYVKDSTTAVTLGRGVALGLLTGIIGAVVDTAFSIPLYLVLSRLGMGSSDQVQHVIELMPNLPPEARAELRALFARGGFSVLFFFANAIAKLAIYSLMAILGASVGVALFEKRDPSSAPAFNPALPEHPPDLPPQPPPNGPTAP